MTSNRAMERYTDHLFIPPRLIRPGRWVIPCAEQTALEYMRFRTCGEALRARQTYNLILGGAAVNTTPWADSHPVQNDKGLWIILDAQNTPLWLAQFDTAQDARTTRQRLLNTIDKERIEK